MDTYKTIFVKSIEPFWTPTQQPEFIRKTGTNYGRSPLHLTLDGRGLDNRLLYSFCDYLPEGAIIAGGFMTSIMQGDKQSNDIDFFFTNEKAFKKTLDMFMNPPEDSEAWAYKGYTLTTEEKNLSRARFVSFKHESRPSVQLIKLVWYDDPEHVIDSFDFTICQFATDGKDLIYNPLGMLDLARKRIVMHRLQFPASTLRRLIKYCQKGYYACPGSLTEISKQLINYKGDQESIVYVD